MVAARAEMAPDSNFNGLRCQTDLKVETDAKSVLGALSNHRSAYRRGGNARG